ncbi:DUF294 nucleotidyltransferase-like domain-containing protein [Desulfosporosinus burensis]
MKLQDFKPFDLLPTSVLEDLENNLTQETYSKDSYVFTEGQRSLGRLFLVISGLAEITKGTGMIGLRRSGEFFGETVILTGKRYPASVIAAENLTCFLLDKDYFDSLLQNYIEFAAYFSHILTDRLRDLYEEMVLDQPYDSFGFGSEPFKQRIFNIMSTPIVTSAPESSVYELARTLSDKKISSVIVSDSNGKMLGLVTERDLITKVLALESNPAVVTVKDIMYKNPPTLPSDALFYQALLTMLKSQGKYIVVMDQTRPIGILTIGDLTKAITTSSLNTVKQIDSATNINELIEATKLINKIVVNMIREKATANEINLVVSELNDILTKRLLVLGENELYRKGFGQPPIDYCWLTLGSGGRKELTLSSDQDNAIIYSDPEGKDELRIAEYFKALAEYVSNGLEKCGVIKCPGDIMATNPAWCRSLSQWKDIVTIWTNSPNLDSSREFTIFLDFRTVYGQNYLAKDLRDFVSRLFRVSPAILHTMAIDDNSHRVPLNLFKQVRVEKNKEHKDEVDLKKAAGVHIVNCARLFAMREGISETSTLGRLEKLVQIKALSIEDAEYYEAAIQSLTMFRIRENLRKLSLGKVPDNYVNPNNLSKRERTVLRESFLATEQFQNFTAFSFQVERG